MTRIAPVLAALAALLLLPSAATAKELTAATACGAAGCRTVDGPPMMLAGGGDGTEDAVPAPSPFYKVTFHVEEQGRDESWDVFWIPAAETLAFRDEAGNMTFDRLKADATTTWGDQSHDAESLAAWKTFTRGLAPFPAPTVTSVTVGGKRADDPDSYLGLFGRDPDPKAYPDATDWLSVELRADVPSPWTDTVLLTVSPSRRVVQVGANEFVRIDADEARAIAARESLDLAAGGVRWTLVAAVGMLVVVLAAAGVFLRRGLRRHERAGALQS